VAIGIARKLEGPMDVLEPLLLGCTEEELTGYVSKMFEAQRSGRWDAFGVKSDDRAVLAPGADVGGFLAAHCPLLELSHLAPEDQTWAVWMMHSGYRLMSAGEGFEAYAEMAPGWEAALAAALDAHGIGRRRALSLVLARLEALEKERSKPTGVKWYLKRKLGREDDGDERDSNRAAVVAYANIGLMFDEGDAYDARYRMRDLYGICHRYHDDRGTFAELNAWFWSRDRTRPYPVPRHGRDTKELLSDLLIWAEHVVPKHKEVVAAFVDGFKSGFIDVNVVRRMRKSSFDINRSYLVENKDDATRCRRPHLHVCRIHSLLDNIEHLSPTDVTTYL
jgi:hypothetical protein